MGNSFHRCLFSHFIFTLASLLLIGCNLTITGGGPSPTASPLPAPTSTPQAGTTPTPGPTATPNPGSTPTPTPTPRAPTPTPTPVNNDAYNIGANIGWITYWNSMPIYSDVTYQIAGNSGRWDASSNDSAAPTDSTGAPTVAAWTGFTADYPSGTYTLTWQGKGSITVTGAAMGTRVTTTVNGVQQNTVSVTLKQNASQGSWTQMTATPPVTNIHLMVPTSNQIAGSIFTADFIAKIRPFSTFRFMDALNTNAVNTGMLENWSQRTWPAAGSRGGTLQGMAYEDIIALANQTGKDVWINIPGLATDDYVCRLARLFAYGESGSNDNGTNCSTTAASSAPPGAVALNSTSKVYIEYSNEVWNWGFMQTEDLYCMANGVPQPGGKCDVTAPPSLIAKTARANHALPWAGSSNLWYNGTQMSTVLTKRDNDIFKAVFGRRANQVRTVMNVQSADAPEIDPGFQFMSQGYGALTGYIDYMAVAPYFNTDSSSYENNLTNLFSDLGNVLLATNPNGNSNSIYQWIQGDLSEANKYGLPLVAYEGGQGLSNGLSIETSAQSQTQMYSLYKQYFAVWDKLVGRSHLFTHYELTGDGNWGALLSLEDAGSQKWNALMSLILVAGDANGDGVVNQADCAILQANYGKTGKFWGQGDFNDDGVVNSDDLAILNANIAGGACSAP